MKMRNVALLCMFTLWLFTLATYRDIMHDAMKHYDYLNKLISDSVERCAR